MKLATSLTPVLVGAVLGLTPEVSAKAREDFEQVIPFSSGGSFSIQNTNGSIRVRTWNEGSVRIEAEKVARTEDRLRDIEIVIESSGDSVRVETVHHRRRGGGSVSYVISLPTDANVDVSTANGAVTVEGIHGRVEAKSTNGSLKLEDIVGEVAARTTNGSIRAHYRQATDGRHHFETTNGSVRVYLPSDAGGDFEAETVNGSIDVDFPTNLSRVSRRHLRGSFGGGGGSFTIETVNGSVKILPH